MHWICLKETLIQSVPYSSTDEETDVLKHILQYQGDANATGHYL